MRWVPRTPNPSRLLEILLESFVRAQQLRTWGAVLPFQNFTSDSVQTPLQSAAHKDLSVTYTVECVTWSFV